MASPVAHSPAQGALIRSLPVRSRRVVSFALIGLICTVAFAGIYALLRTFLSPISSNVLALSITMILNFAANRSLTFRESAGSFVSQGVGYLAVYLLGMAASSAALAIGIALLHHPPAAVETLLAVAAGGFATVIRFVLLSAWVFRADRSSAPEEIRP